MVQGIIELSPGAWLTLLQPGLDHEVEFLPQTKPWLSIDAFKLEDTQVEADPNVVPFRSLRPQSLLDFGKIISIQLQWRERGGSTDCEH